MEFSLGEVLVVPFFGQGHLFPCMELCKRFTAYQYKAILVISSNLSASVPSSFRDHSLVEVFEIPNSSDPPPLAPSHMGVSLDKAEGIGPGSGFGLGPNPPFPPPEMEIPPPLAPEMAEELRPGSGKPFPRRPLHQNPELESGIESFLCERYKNPGHTRPVCAVFDVMMSWSKEAFAKHEIPTVAFFTSGACSAAMEYAGWEAKVGEMKLGEIRKLDGLPENMALSYSDLKMQQHGRPSRHPGNIGGPPGMDGPSGPDGPPAGRKFGPPGPGNKPRWMDEIEGSIALLFNTCDDLEGHFISYLANKIDKPIYGIGPLLPEDYWKPFDSNFYDGKSRSNRKSNYTEDEVAQWLNSKPPQSVIYVSFGSEVGPTLEEYAELATALEELNRPFIWVIQPNSGRQGPPPGFFGGQPGMDSKEEKGYFPQGLDEKGGDRGLIIKGWAPQLLILSHPALGGFLSHCGWNSTVEAICRGVPILAWPIRGDQFYDAKLVVNYLCVGRMLLNGDDTSEMVKKDDIMQGIDLLLDDTEARKCALTLRSIFKDDFPASSVASLKSFVRQHLVSQVLSG